MKPLTQITEPDERQRFLTGSLPDLHAELAAIRLNDGVPEAVRDLFDLARNASLYSWFVNDFHQLADLTGFLTMEAAFRARAMQQSKTLANKRLKEVVRHAVAAGWVTEDRIGGRRAIACARVKQRKGIEAIKRAEASGATEVSVDEPTEEELSAESASMKLIENMCLAGVDLRNALAHGKAMVIPGSYHRLRTIADLINQLFSPAGTAS